MLVVNLWGAPSSGKSTTAAGLFFLLKINKWRVELITEFAKEMVWERNENIFGDQMFIFAEQNRRLRRLESHDVDVAITDSPLPLPSFYKPKGYLEQFDGVVMEQFNRYNNVNYLLERESSFEAIGRRHNEQEALQLAGELKHFMDERHIEYLTLTANPKTPEAILQDLERRRSPPIVTLPFGVGDA